MRRTVIIVNPTAGQARPLAVAEDARRFLEATGWTAEILPTEAPGHATELAREHAAGVERVVVVGGDGTLRETVVGMPDRTVPVALVPIGKANVVARDLRIPRTPAAAVRALASERVVAMDVGRVDDSIFLAMVGVGYDGWVTAGVGRMRAGRAGAWLYRHGGSSLIYLLAGLPSLLRLRPTRVRVTIDGAESPRAYPSLVVSNTETYSLGWSMTPGASLHDELALLVAAGLSPREALLAATRNAARVLGVDSIGVLAAGKAADFVVLTGDPLTDIHNTRTIDRVVFKGASYHPDEFKLEW